MKKIYCAFLLCLLKCESEANLSGPSVYVVTPSPRSHQENEARSAPFYYHNWMRRMDSPKNDTTTTTTTTPKVKTPDLIFAEFESENGDNMRKSIRKLLEQERVKVKTPTTTTSTSKPIYVAEASNNNVNQETGYVVSTQESKTDTKTNEVDQADYFSLYNNYGNVNSYVPTLPAPVYSPSTTSPRTTTTTTTTTPAPTNVENIWHIIDSEKHNEYSNDWVELPVQSNSDQDQRVITNDDDDGQIDENFALPGFGANPGNGAENESRAIRTEPNFRFPYVSLKPFVMKNVNKPNVISQSKKGSNMFNLDDFKEIKHPVRGEIQDIVMREPVDRYNPAQPYLPHDYGSKSKQSSPPAPSKTVANLVPPPPPPPKVAGDDFPAPTNYESFPPYPPALLSPAQPPSPPINPPVSVYKPPSDSSNSFDSYASFNDNTGSAPMDADYSYKPPSPPSFVPTLPPLNKPSDGFPDSYSKQANNPDSPPASDMSGYSYNQPPITLDSPPTMNTGGYNYNKPAMTFDSPPTVGMGYSYSKPQKEFPSIPDFKPNYQYGRPDTPDDHPAPSYGPSPPSSDNDYPELLFDNSHGGKGGHDIKGNDMGMMPPPPPPAMQPGSDSGPPSSDNGFPSDFPGDLKFQHDFDDDDFHHYHHHHPKPTTTTTTTEMPRVSRFSYYYLGKKLYYLPLYFSVYFIVYVATLIIKAVLRHKIVYPNSWRPNDTTASFFAKRSVDSWDLSNENLHEVTGRVTKAIAEAAEKYVNENAKTKLS